MTWTHRPLESDGVEILGWRECSALLGETLKNQAVHLYGLARLPIIRLLDRSTSASAPLPSPPDTAWAECARRRAAEMLNDLWLRHSERTWLFASLLAQRDEDAFRQEPVNRELLYVACLLHDTGLQMQLREGCFAVAGAGQAAETAAQAGVTDDESIEAVSLAISSHISINPRNPLGDYVQAGSLLDITGTRVWDLDRATLDSVCRELPRTGFPADMRRKWSEECARFPYGRAAFARWPAGMIIASHLAPLPRSCRAERPSGRN